MYIISALTKRDSDSVYLIEHNDKYMWIVDVSRIKIHSDPSSATLLLSEALSNPDAFENFEIVDSLTIQIYQLQMKQIWREL